jgi:hypothetical protein
MAGTSAKTAFRTIIDFFLILPKNIELKNFGSLGLKVSHALSTGHFVATAYSGGIETACNGKEGWIIS